MKIWEVDLNYGKKYACSDGGNYEVSMFKDNMFDSRGVAITEKYTLYQLLKMDFEEVIDWSKIPVDTKVLVSNDGKKWHKRHYLEYVDNLFLHTTFIDGKSEFTNNKNDKCYWRFCKLYQKE